MRSDRAQPRARVKIAMLFLALGTATGGTSLGGFVLRRVIGWRWDDPGQLQDLILLILVMGVSITVTASVTAILLRVALRRVITYEEFVVLFVGRSADGAVGRFVRWFLNAF